MTKREISTGGIMVIILVAFGVGIFAYSQGYLDFMFRGDVFPIYPVDVEEGVTLAHMKTWVVAENNISDDIESKDIYIWYDWNKDGVMQRGAFQGYVDGQLLGGEIERTVTGSSDGYFTSRVQYPVGRPIHVFVDTGADGGYQNTYATITMTGSPDTSNTITTPDIICRATDDAITYAGLIRGVAINDGTDYNYTTNGATGTMELRASLATSDAGFNSQTEGNPTYAGNGRWTHWGSGKEYAASFVGGYCTNQDAIDLGLSSGDFDFYYQGVTNTYFATFLDDYDGDANTFYSSDDSSAPTWTFSFGVDISAVGEMVYIGLFQDVEWKDFVLGIWNPTTDANILGTLGNDWDWVAL